MKNLAKTARILFSYHGTSVRGVSLSSEIPYKKGRTFALFVTVLLISILTSTLRAENLDNQFDKRITNVVTRLERIDKGQVYLAEDIAGLANFFKELVKGLESQFKDELDLEAAKQFASVIDTIKKDPKLDDSTELTSGRLLILEQRRNRVMRSQIPFIMVPLIIDSRTHELAYRHALGQGEERIAIIDAIYRVWAEKTHQLLTDKIIDWSSELAIHDTDIAEMIRRNRAFLATNRAFYSDEPPKDVRKRGEMRHDEIWNHIKDLPSCAQISIPTVIFNTREVQEVTEATRGFILMLDEEENSSYEVDSIYKKIDLFWTAIESLIFYTKIKTDIDKLLGRETETKIFDSDEYKESSSVLALCGNQGIEACYKRDANEIRSWRSKDAVEWSVGISHVDAYGKPIRKPWVSYYDLLRDSIVDNCV